MWKFIFSLLTVVVLGATFNHAAMAQVSADSASGSQAVSGSQAGAVGLIVNQGAGRAAAPAIGSTLSYSDTRSYNTTNESVDLGDTVPNLWVPGPGGGGTNPCIVTVGGGAVGSGFGLGFSRGYNDEECQVRETLRIMAAQMNPESPQADRVMKNIACQSKIVQTAMRESGLRCVNDPAPRARRTRSTSTLSASAPRPAATSGKAAAYAACRKVSDSEFSNCMRKARNS